MFSCLCLPMLNQPLNLVYIASIQHKFIKHDDFQFKIVYFNSREEDSKGKLLI